MVTRRPLPVEPRKGPAGISKGSGVASRGDGPLGRSSERFPVVAGQGGGVRIHGVGRPRGDGAVAPDAAKPSRRHTAGGGATGARLAPVSQSERRGGGARGGDAANGRDGDGGGVRSLDSALAGPGSGTAPPAGAASSPSGWSTASARRAHASRSMVSGAPSSRRRRRPSVRGARRETGPARRLPSAAKAGRALSRTIPVPVVNPSGPASRMRRKRHLPPPSRRNQGVKTRRIRAAATRRTTADLRRIPTAGRRRTAGVECRVLVGFPHLPSAGAARKLGVVGSLAG